MIRRKDAVPPYAGARRCVHQCPVLMDSTVKIADLSSQWKGICVMLSFKERVGKTADAF